MVDKASAKLHVGKGWHPLIDIAYDIIEANGINVLQVKEKWGTLHIYTGGAPTALLNYISSIEKASAHICEVCGRPGKRRNMGWVRTLCNECVSKSVDTFNICPNCGGSSLRRKGERIVEQVEYVTAGCVQLRETEDRHERIGVWYLTCEDCEYEWIIKRS